MSITTYDELKSAITDWLKDDDVATRVDDFITAAEERHRNQLRIRAMEKRATATGDGTRYLPLPTGYLQMRRLRRTNNPVALVQLTSPSQLIEYWETSVGNPTHFAVSNQIEFNRPHTTELEMFYYKEFDALSASNPTNWLLTNAPFVYLYGALLHSAPYIRDSERISEWNELYEQHRVVLVKSDRQGQRAAGPFVSRVKGVTP